MDGNIDKILGGEEVKDAIDDLCEDVKDFDKVVFVHIVWGKREKDGSIEVNQGFHGSANMLISELDKAKFTFLKEAICGEEGD